MKINKSFIIRISVILLLLLLTLVGFYLYQISNKVTYYIRKKDDIKKVYQPLDKEGKYVLYDPKVSSEGYGHDGDLGGRYVASIEGKFEREVGGKEVQSHTQRKGEYYHLVLYDLDKNYQESKVDLYQLFRDQAPDYVPSAYYRMVYYKNQEYAWLGGKKISGQQVTKTRKNFFYNLKTKKLEAAPEKFKAYKANVSFSPLRYPLNWTTFNKVVNKAVGEGIYTLGGTVEASDYKGSVLNTNVNLFADYPELETKLKEDWVLYPRPDRVSEEEWANQLLYWFAPKGEEVLEVYGVLRNSEKGGDPIVTDTPIRSYQDYQAWLKAHPELTK
ncbi:hypothetical protein [Streptococcus oricebi]|uniref:Lipoprotein n=1 Tax=Streptococcus oricebi TaxID=1547447 RepID=A0ABS5B4Y6_9STRE|nr:hypothetical protein [Streptococcus oricebi]MBP2623897.1 hypothetical protein [Streptococcus oricebi]